MWTRLIQESFDGTRTGDAAFQISGASLEAYKKAGGVPSAYSSDTAIQDLATSTRRPSRPSKGKGKAKETAIDVDEDVDTEAVAPKKGKPKRAKKGRPKSSEMIEISDEEEEDFSAELGPKSNTTLKGAPKPKGPRPKPRPRRGKPAETETQAAEEAPTTTTLRNRKEVPRLDLAGVSIKQMCKEDENRVSDDSDMGMDIDDDDDDVPISELQNPPADIDISPDDIAVGDILDELGFSDAPVPVAQTGAQDEHASPDQAGDNPNNPIAIDIVEDPIGTAPDQDVWRLVHDRVFGGNRHVNPANTFHGERVSFFSRSSTPSTTQLQFSVH